MNNTRLKLYNHGGFISAFFMLFASLAFLIVTIILAVKDFQGLLFAIVLVGLIGAIGLVVAIIALTSQFTDRTIIDDETISCFNRNGLVKSIEISNLKRIAVYSIKCCSEISRIIFDDGSFNEYGSCFYAASAQAITDESWIAVTYGKKRLQLLKDRFSSIQFEFIERIPD